MGRLLLENHSESPTTTKCACCCVQSMFDLLLNSGGQLDITNRQGLTPLTLAAKLARKDVSVEPSSKRHTWKLSSLSGIFCWILM